MRPEALAKRVVRPPSMPTLAGMNLAAAPTPGPLVVRLRNWVGDVVLSVPALRRLEAAGHDLHLVGKGWAADLLGGHGWKVHPMRKGRWDRVAQLRELRRQLGPSVRSLLFPYAFSAALEFRLAGFSPDGFSGQCRGWLLGRSFRRPRGLHTAREYWSLAQSFLGADEPMPSPADWRFTPAAEAEADRLALQHGLTDGHVVLIPFASNGPDDPRVWPGFPRLAAELAASGRRIVLCPGSAAETEAARSRYPDAATLPGVGMSAYGVLMRRAALVLACDTGPGHLAAAAGANVVSIFGPSSPDLWAPVGPRARILRAREGWPSVEEVARFAGSPTGLA